MLEKSTERIFSFFQTLIFIKIGYKFRADLLKGFTDKAFVLIEKFSAKFDFLSKIYINSYKELIENEIKLLDIKRKDLVLVIGCGSIPVTPILLSSITGANVESIDFDNKSVLLSKQFIKKLNLNDKVKITFAQGDSFPIDKFDLIIIAYGIVSEEKVLNHLAKNMKPSAKVILRTTVSASDIKNRNQSISSQFDISKKIRTSSFGQTDSLLLLKKQNI
jgi:precorrin-6B methylase 2